jgi:hypothetical protein
MIEVQEPTEPLATLDRAVVVSREGLGIDQLVAETLMMSLGIVVLDELPNDQPKVSLAEGDDVIETLAPNGADEALGKSIQIRALGWEFEWLDASVAEDGGEPHREEGVAIMNEESVFSQEAIERISQVAGNLFEELSTGPCGNVGDLDASRFEIDDKKDEIANEPSARENLDRKEIRGGDGAEVRSQEGGPSRLAIRSRIDATLFQYAGDCAASDSVAEG